MDPGVRCCGMKANPTRYLWCKYECFLTGCQDMDTQCDGNLTPQNGNDRGDYNSSLHFRAVELKIVNGE